MRLPLLTLRSLHLQVVSRVDFTQPIGKEILMVDSSPSSSLPASVLLQTMVVPGHAVNINSFRILVQNQSLKETVILV